MASPTAYSQTLDKSTLIILSYLSSATFYLVARHPAEGIDCQLKDERHVWYCTDKTSWVFSKYGRNRSSKYVFCFHYCVPRRRIHQLAFLSVNTTANNSEIV